DHHALVNGITGPHEHAPARLELEERVRNGLALLGRDEHAVAPLRHVRLYLAVLVEHVAHDSRAARQIEKFGLETDQPARRNAIFEAHASLAVRLHITELATPCAEGFHGGALVLLVEIDREQFVRLAAPAADVAHQHARAGNGQLIALAP